MRDLALLLVIFTAVAAFMMAGSLALRQYFQTQAQQQVQHSLRFLCQQNSLNC